MERSAGLGRELLKNASACLSLPAMLYLFSLTRALMQSSLGTRVSRSELSWENRPGLASLPLPTLSGPKWFSVSSKESAKPGFPSLSTAEMWDQIILGVKGAVLCIVGCLAASLESTQQEPGPSPPRVVTTKSVPRY